MIVSKKIKQLLACILIVMVTISSCSPRNGAQEPWLVVGSETVREDEAMLYLLQTYNDFETLGGEDVWMIKDFSGGKSASEVGKQGALDNLIKVKVLTSKSYEQNIDIGAEVKTDLESQAKTYYDLLPEGFAKNHNVTETSVYKVLEENHRAKEVEALTIENYELDSEEIENRMNTNSEYVKLKSSEPADILTSYQVQHIVVYTHVEDSQGTWTLMNEEELKTAELKINQAFEALDNGDNFENVLKNTTEDPLSESEDLSIMLSKFQLPESFILTLDNLDVGDYSVVIKGDFGYHIFKLLSVAEPDDEMIEAYKVKFTEWEQSLLEDTKNTLYKEAFDTIYNKWLQNTKIELTTPWLDVEILEILDSGDQS
jgi:hypothetical protein